MPPAFLPEYLYPVSFSPTTVRRFPKGERKALWCARRRKPLPPWGLTRRLRREWMGLPPRRGIVLSFDAKESTKESQRHGDSGKKASNAHFDGGARYVARSIVGQLTPTVVRARSSPFSAAKMGGPFSLRCLSPLCSPAVGGRHTQPLRVGKFQCGLGIFAAQKSSLFFKTSWTLKASHEARRRMAVYAIQLAGSRTRPASRGQAACRSSSPAPNGRGVGCRALPCQTGEPRGLPPSGGSFTAKPHVPRVSCAP